MGTETFLAKQKPDPLWDAIMKEIQALEDSGLHMSTRSAAYTQGDQVKMAIVKFYDGAGDDNTRQLYYIEARVNRKGNVETDVNGPFEDAGDRFWKERYERDQAYGDWIVTEDYHHYVIHKDSKNPGQGDGHGGSLFRFVIVDDAAAGRFRALGFKVTDYNHEGEDWYLLESRNVWSQDLIPKKHRHMFTPNAKILPRQMGRLPDTLF